ncbi:dCTP deaminase [Myxosarcina sp. GI1]|uniref:dCTP deaminase n=1 Tax=Myxosarcina sp. GI1 TaxID=1541065 RepID=UPI00155B04DF|nr:dCTP deaminase [Myxosarcina sp. GI1]
MRVSSTDIRKFIQQGCLKITGNINHEFESSTQIRPASIDIHVSNIFWKFKQKESDEIDILDLDKAKEIKQNPELLYDRIELKSHEHLTLDPGDIILTETLEEIELPNFLSASLKGRSSYARLGISIHCTGDYINPGYKGHMPMQIVNHSPKSVKIYPFLKLAQLVFYKLSSQPDINYQSLPNTIYNSDNCDTEGLSLWFVDKDIENFANRVSGKKFAKDTEDKIRNLVERSEKRIFKQMEEHLARNKITEPNQIEEEIKNYEIKDVKRDKKMRLTFWFFSIVFGADLSILIPSVIEAVSTNDFQNPMFWISSTILIFSVIILWITFDYRFIGL